MDFDERYRIIGSRDARFDGQFITAVRSTGIYCRPSCPARTPKASNVTFYETSAAAHEAGYRACKRCLPEAVPGTPAWNLRDDLAARSMRLIGDGVVEREGVDGLAARLGYSPRHLTRVLTQELGAGPLALARAHRAQTARTLLTATDLPMADVAFAAGFTSIRQFNDTVGEVFQLTPSEIRARRSHSEAAAPGALRLSLPYREPFDAEGVFRWLAARAIPGVERVEGRSYTRSLLLPGGPSWFTVRHEPGRPLELDARLTVLGDLPVLVARIRRLFDLDADPVAVDEALLSVTHTPGLPGGSELAARVRATPGIRMPGAVDPHEMLVRAIVGQQITVTAARTLLHRLAVLAGTPLAPAAPDDPTDPTGPTHTANPADPADPADPTRTADPAGTANPADPADPDDPTRTADPAGTANPADPAHTADPAGTADPADTADTADPADPAGEWMPTLLFPTPAQIVAHADELLTGPVLAGPRAKAATLLTAMQAIAAGELELTSGDDPVEQRARLVALPGIGDWTAGYLAMRVLGSTDVLPTGDVALRNGAAALGAPSVPRELAAWAAPFAPWRTYLALHLWAAAPPPARGRRRPAPALAPSAPPDAATPPPSSTAPTTPEETP